MEKKQHSTQTLRLIEEGRKWREYHKPFFDKMAKILDNKGIPRLSRIEYWNFSRVIAKHSQIQLDNALDRYIDAEKAKFIQLGCHEEILNLIEKSLHNFLCEKSK